MTYRLGRRFLLVENVAMVNLIAGRRIVPELIQDDCTAENVAAETLSLLTDPNRAEQARRGLADVRAKLGGPGASGRAAEAVLEIIDVPRVGDVLDESRRPTSQTLARRPESEVLSSWILIRLKG